MTDTEKINKIREILVNSNLSVFEEATDALESIVHIVF